MFSYSSKISIFQTNFLKVGKEESFLVILYESKILMPCSNENLKKNNFMEPVKETLILAELCSEKNPHIIYNSII